MTFDLPPSAQYSQRPTERDLFEARLRSYKKWAKRRARLRILRGIRRFAQRVMRWVRLSSSGNCASRRHDVAIPDVPRR